MPPSTGPSTSVCLVRWRAAKRAWISDIDLLVTMEKGRSYFDLVGLWQDLEELLGRKVDVVTDGGLSPYLKDRILAEAVPL